MRLLALNAMKKITTNKRKPQKFTIISQQILKNLPFSSHSLLKDAGLLLWKNNCSPLVIAIHTLFFLEKPRTGENTQKIGWKHPKICISFTWFIVFIRPKILKICPREYIVAIGFVSCVHLHAKSWWVKIHP